VFRRRHPQLDDVTVAFLDDEEPALAEIRSDDLAVLRRIACEALILQDEAEDVLEAVRARESLAVLAPRGGRLASRVVALAQARCSATARGCARSWTTTR
jgi:hypothetical protein